MKEILLNYVFFTKKKVGYITYSFPHPIGSLIENEFSTSYHLVIHDLKFLKRALLYIFLCITMLP